MVRFYQTLNTLPFMSLGADPLVLVRRAPKIGNLTALSSFAATKRVTNRLLGNPKLPVVSFLQPNYTPVLNGILAFDSGSFIRGNLAAP